MARSEHIGSNLLSLLAEICGGKVQFSEEVCRGRGQRLFALLFRHVDGMREQLNLLHQLTEVMPN